MSREAICADGNDAILRVRVTPRAKRTELAGPALDSEGAERLSVRLAAPPVDNAANRALIEFLAGALGLPRSRIEIVFGETSRLKTVRITGVRAIEVQQKLAPPRP